MCEVRFVGHDDGCDKTTKRVIVVESRLQPQLPRKMQKPTGGKLSAVARDLWLRCSDEDRATAAIVAVAAAAAAAAKFVPRQIKNKMDRRRKTKKK